MVSQPVSGEPEPRIEVSEIQDLVARFRVPSVPRAVWQIVSTLVPYAAVWVLMYYSLSISYWLTLPLAVLAGALLVRVFIIFHDCGHGSFFSSRWANDIAGFTSGVLTCTPYYHWRWEHSLHHATAGDLDRRGIGDVWTLTVQEYLESTRWRRLAYRFARNPFVLFVVAPIFVFVIYQRLPNPKANRRERMSVAWMNLALALQVLVMSWIFGLVPYLLIQLTVMAIAGAAGVWLFYVQHQFEGAYWERHEEWDFTAAALRGSSFYKMPRILQWFSGNIGFHHIHHLSPRIPNYHLERCHRAHPVFQAVKPITLFGSLKSLGYRLWDEQQRRLVGYSHLRRLRRGSRQIA